MRKNISLLASTLLFSLVALQNAQGQSVSPSTLNATGSSAIIGSNEFDWSVGEMTMVSTFETPSIIVTQGVLQPVDTFETTGIAQVNLLHDIRIFPNPTTALVNMEYSVETGGMLRYQLMDMTGKIFIEHSIQTQTGAGMEQINLAGMASATYLLRVAYISGGGEKEMTSYKIQKLK